MSLVWYGKQVLSAVKEATKGGINATMLECVLDAQGQLYPGHGFRYGFMQGSLKSEAAVEENDAIVGRWGSFTVNYTLFQETRLGFLRYAVDRQYPELAKRIMERLGK